MKSWTRCQATRYLTKFWVDLPIVWKLRLTYTKQTPAWVGDEEAWGCMQVVNIPQRVAKIWVQAGLSIAETKEVLIHESLHVLFASAGIDDTTLRNHVQGGLSHQIVESLAPLLVRGV